MYNQTKVLVVALAFFLSACGSTSSNKTSEEPASNKSGFLSDYSQLKPVDTNDDSQLTRFINKDLKARKYSSVILEPVSYYPAPQTTDTVSNKV